MLTIYKASAGSGKTYNLALSYIRHLLGFRSPADARIRPYKGATARNHRSILAITFTNAATEEMKTRIIKRLAQLADNPEESDYIDNLTKVFGVDAETIRQASRHALSELLYDYSNFFVSTIDSFFQTVLRTFAREVDQQGDYELSLEQKTIVPEVISLMLEELNRTPGYLEQPLYKWIMSQAVEKTEIGKTPNYFDREGSLLATLAENVNNSMEEVYHSYGGELDKYLANPGRLSDFILQIKTRQNSIYHGIKDKAEALQKMLETYDFDSLKPVFMRAVKNGKTPRSIDSDDIATATVGKIAGDPLANMANKKAEFRKKLPEDIQNRVATMAGQYCQTLIDSVKAIELYDLLYEGAVHLQFISLFRKELAKYLRDSNILLISDTGELLKRIISDQEMPFIYERLGMRLDSLLIDEFQDTSKLQWENLKPLVTNSISQGESLIIGDVKQSIYRFRNSDSSLLDHQVQEDEAIAPFVVHRGMAPEDNTNRRSARDIVRFNNTFFNYVARELGMSSYDGVIQELNSSNSDSAVIHITVEEKPDVAAVNKDLKLRWKLDTLADNILNQHNRGYRWKDIAILVNTHNQAREIITYFLENYPQIRLLSNEALLLSNSPAVRTVMSLLSLVTRDIVENPRIKNTSEGEAEETGSPAIHNKNDLTTLLTRFNYHRSKGLTYQDSLQKALEQVENKESGMLEERIGRIRKKKSTNLVTLIENIISEEISEEERRNQIAFLTALQDRATAHCLGPDPSVAAFLRAYELNISRWSIKAPNSLDAVKVMTIHASKGLEWPCVHIPYAEWKMFKGGQKWFVLENGIPSQPGIFEDGFESSIVPPILRLKVNSEGVLYEAPAFKNEVEANRRAEMLDNLNKLYVAFTRAGRELHALFSYNSKLTRESTYSCALGFMQNFSGERVTDSRQMCIAVTDMPATDAHGPLKEFSYCTGGVLPEFRPKEGTVGDVAETEITQPYIAVPRPELGKLIAIEDLTTLNELNTGIEQSKDVAGETEAAKEAVDSAVYKAAVRGIHLHSVLADMITLSDMDKALARLKVRQKLADIVIEEYRAILEDAFAGQSRAKEWFDASNTVKNEQSFYDPSGGEAHEGQILRPDRIVWRPDGSVVVVDYKFVGRPTHEQQDEYRSQVSQYVLLLRRMGYENVTGAIWYPRKNRIVDINP